jgi:hypothetical protein
MHAAFRKEAAKNEDIRDYRLHVVEGDGNCASRSIAVVKYGNENKWRRVKDDITEYATENFEYLSRLIAGFDTEEVLNMMESGAWQSEVFLAVCAYAYEWNIFLHGVGHDSAYPSGKKGSKSVHLFYYKDHFSPLVPLKKTHMSKRTKTAPAASDSSSDESSVAKPKPKKKSSNKMSKRTKTAPAASDSSSDESSVAKPEPKKKSSNTKSKRTKTAPAASDSSSDESSVAKPEQKKKSSNTKSKRTKTAPATSDSSSDESSVAKPEQKKKSSNTTSKRTKTAPATSDSSSDESSVAKPELKSTVKVVRESSDDDSTVSSQYSHSESVGENEDDRSEGSKLESQPVTDNLDTILTPKVAPIYPKPTSGGSAGKKIVSFFREVAEKVGVATPTRTAAASIADALGAEVGLNEEEEEVVFQTDEVPTAPAHKNDSPASSEKESKATKTRTHTKKTSDEKAMKSPDPPEEKKTTKTAPVASNASADESSDEKPEPKKKSSNTKSKRTKTAPVASDSSSDESSDEKPKPKKKSSNKKEEDEEDTVVKSRRRSARERKPKRY